MSGREAPPLVPVDAEVDATIGRASDVLARAGRVAAACHIGPDGDALGSLLAVGLALGRMGKDVTIGWGTNPIVVPAQYAFLPGTELLRAPEDFPDEAVALAIDCASADRLGCLQERFEASGVVVNLDHHPSNTRFGTINLVDESAPSSSELVLRLLETMGAPVTREVATCLYTGLMTDTGSFRHANATPRAHMAAARLIEWGVPVATISQAVFESHPFGYLKTLGILLARARLYDDPPLVVSFLRQEDLEVSLDETEEVIDVVRSIREADVAAILKELDDGRWKVSLRSKGATDVGAIATALGGGGHPPAAGYTSSLDLEGTIEQIRAALRVS